MSRQRSILLLAIGSQAALSMITFGLPAIGSDIESKFGLGAAAFGAVFAAVGVGSGLALVPAGHAGRSLRRTPNPDRRRDGHRRRD